VDVSPDGLRSAFIFVAGQSIAGFSNDRLSQPDDGPAWYATIVGTGTPGAVVVGFAPPTVVAVNLELGTGETVALPVVQQANETWFAAPLPTGLDPVDFVFLDGVGHLLRTVNVPTIPPDPSGSSELIAG
jgi:hypothetical protein